MGITSKVIAARGQRQAKERGLDPGRVPPGQYLTERFPVLTYGDNPPFDLNDLVAVDLGRGREPVHAALGRAHGAPAARGHDRHPLRHALVQARHDVARRPGLATCSSARRSSRPART